MTPVTAAAPARLVLATLMAALLAGVATVERADGAERAWSAYLAPAAACPGSDRASALPRVQRRALACLLNWARARERLGGLDTSPRLQQAAALKGRRVASCGDFSHTPCGADFTAAARAAGYRYSSFAENLFAGTQGYVTPRSVVEAWLGSAGHRANILGSGFRQLGLAVVPARDLLGSGRFVVWVATFGTPR